jgi:hypothetical protein
MHIKPTRIFIGAIVAVTLGTVSVPFGSTARISTIAERALQSEAFAEDDSQTVQDKTEQKTTESTDSAGIPQTDKHVEQETTETAQDSNGATQSRQKDEASESSNAMGSTTTEKHETTEKSQQQN